MPTPLIEVFSDRLSSPEAGEGQAYVDMDPDTIKSLRKQRDQSQTEFGLELGDYSENYAQKRVSQLESGKETPTAAERRTLQRMEEGEI